MNSPFDSELTQNKFYNFLINSSNQANLAGDNKTTAYQINSIFIMISPSFLDQFSLEGLDIDVKMDENGIMWINDRAFKGIEIKPGINVFGVSRQGCMEEEEPKPENCEGNDDV